MNYNKFIIIFLSTFLLFGCTPKSNKSNKPPGDSQSSIYLEEQNGADPDFYFFRVIDRATAVQPTSGPTHAVVKQFYIDVDGAKFLGGTNPSLSFHLLEETLVVKTRLKSKPIPTGFKSLNNASDAKSDLPSSNVEEEIAFLFTNRRLDLPFILIETYRGKAKIAEAVENLLNEITETRSAEFRFQRKGTNDNPYTKLLSLNLNYVYKEEDLPKSLVDYLKD